MAHGTLSFIAIPNQQQLERYTQQVIRNNGFDERDTVRVAGADDNGGVIPRRAGGASPIKPVIYVVKKNRTYDQVFGSLGRGNGDPNLNLFGDDLAPNTRRLARDFVTLDNFYATAYGWNWSTQANANTYVQKTWPVNYGRRGRGYDFEGGNLATAAGRDPKTSYPWDRLIGRGIDFRSYGFFSTGTPPGDHALGAAASHQPPVPGLQPEDL